MAWLSGKERRSVARPPGISCVERTHACRAKVAAWEDRNAPKPRQQFQGVLRCAGDEIVKAQPALASNTLQPLVCSSRQLMFFPISLARRRKRIVKQDRVQTLNYCAHAIEDLREAETVFQRVAPRSAQVLHRLIDMLQQSVKFILPNCCNLVEPDEIRQAHLDLVRLPFPCVAFEAPWEQEEDGIKQLGEFEQKPATRRIALCWEPRPEYELWPGLYSLLSPFPEGGVFVVPIYWGPDAGKWMPALGGLFFPYENTLRKSTLEQSPPASRIAHGAMIEAGLVKANANQSTAEPFYLLPEIFENTVSRYGDPSKAYAQIYLDAHDETLLMIQACSVINCANVTTAEIGAPAALNKKRQASGKQPFFSYKVLQLAEDKRAAGKDMGTGQHASPRMHLRRGHLRRLEGKVVWVRPSMVNAESSRGAVLKDYGIQGSGERHTDG